MNLKTHSKSSAHLLITEHGKRRIYKTNLSPLAIKKKRHNMDLKVIIYKVMINIQDEYYAIFHLIFHNSNVFFS